MANFSGVSVKMAHFLHFFTVCVLYLVFAFENRQIASGEKVAGLKGHWLTTLRLALSQL